MVRSSGPMANRTQSMPRFSNWVPNSVKCAPPLTALRPMQSIALLHSYESRWAIDFQPHTREYDQQQVLLRFYDPLEQIATSNGQADRHHRPRTCATGGLHILVAPSLNVIDDALAVKLSLGLKLAAIFFSVRVPE